MSNLEIVMMMIIPLLIVLIINKRLSDVEKKIYTIEENEKQNKLNEITLSKTI